MAQTKILTSLASGLSINEKKLIKLIEGNAKTSVGKFLVKLYPFINFVKVQIFGPYRISHHDCQPERFAIHATDF